jgi:hypothetical protein
MSSMQNNTNNANNQLSQDLNQSQTGQVCKNLITRGLNYQEGANMLKREPKPYPPTKYDDLDTVMLEEGEGKYVAI